MSKIQSYPFNNFQRPVKSVKLKRSKKKSRSLPTSWNRETEKDSSPWLVVISKKSFFFNLWGNRAHFITVFLFFLSFFCFLKAKPWHMEVPKLGVKLAYTTETRDPNHTCDLHHSSWQHWFLNPLSEAGNPTCILMDASQICFCWTTMGTPFFFLILKYRWFIILFPVYNIVNQYFILH